MAGIDKTYINKFEDYKAVIDWAKDKYVPLKNGEKISVFQFIWYPDITKEQWEEKEELYKEKYPNWEYEAVLWNTPIYLDVWLIRNCPFDFIQDRLKEQYGGGWSKVAFTEHNHSSLYDEIKAGVSIYDTYQRNGLGKNSKVKVKFYGTPFRDKKMYWWIDVNPYWNRYNNQRLIPVGEYRKTYWYYDKDDSWYVSEELMPWHSSSCNIEGPLSRKNIVNLIKKWNFPAGTIVSLEGYYTFKGRRSLICEYVCTIS